MIKKIPIFISLQETITFDIESRVSSKTFSIFNRDSQIPVKGKKSSD